MQIVHSQENHDNDYVAAAVDTALDIHLHQPPGDILVFLTGQAEIDKVISYTPERMISSLNVGGEIGILFISR